MCVINQAVLGIWLSVDSLKTSTSANVLTESFQFVFHLLRNSLVYCLIDEIAKNVRGGCTTQRKSNKDSKQLHFPTLCCSVYFFRAELLCLSYVLKLILKYSLPKSICKIIHAYRRNIAFFLQQIVKSDLYQYRISVSDENFMPLGRVNKLTAIKFAIPQTRST